MYDDGNVKIEAITIDFWWRAPRVMEVSVIGGGTVTNAHYFRIVKRMPEAVPSYNEVFVYYQDGNARIIPFPPTNISWVPYGASVQIGATPDSQRPFTDVDTIVVDPVDLSADITFLDSSVAHVEFWVDRNRHVVDVNGITYNTTTTSFARMRSMWVADGKADIDRVTSQQGTFPMHKDWSRLDGTWWTFDHAVPSYHNTYCPDFEIEVISTQICYAVLQAEAPLSSSNTTVGVQTNAAGGNTLCMSALGSEASYEFALSYDRPGSRLVLRYADEDGGDNGAQLGNSVDVYIDGAIAERIHTVNTGDTNTFELLPAVELGDLVQGVHTVKLVTGVGPGGMYLDELCFVDRRRVQEAETSLVTVEGEAWVGGTNHTTATRSGASGGETVHLEVTGAVPAEVEYTVTVPSSCSNVFVRATYSDDVGPNKVEFYLNGEIKGKFPSEATGGWTVFDDSAPIYLGEVASGIHTARLVSSIETFGVDIDKFELFKSDKLNRQPQLAVPSPHELIVGSTTSFYVTAYDPDGDYLVVSNTAGPASATFACDEFTWMADAASGGSTSLAVFVATDERGTTNSTVTNGATIAVPYDSDSDNLADGWEWLSFTTLIYVATNDYDNDGSDNLSEFFAGTLPTDGDSLFEIDGLGATGPESPCQLNVRTEPGRTYAIYYVDGSVSNEASWMPFANSGNGIGTWIETSTVSTVYTFIDDYSADTTAGEPVSGMRRYHIKVMVP